MESHQLFCRVQEFGSGSAGYYAGVQIIKAYLGSCKGVLKAELEATRVGRVRNAMKKFVVVLRTQLGDGQDFDTMGLSTYQTTLNLYIIFAEPEGSSR